MWHIALGYTMADKKHSMKLNKLGGMLALGFRCGVVIVYVRFKHSSDMVLVEVRTSRVFKLTLEVWF